MAQVKRAGYPSRQHRAGPAPLASFEDLPSDELESPDSLAELEECAISGQASRPVDLDGSSTPRTLTASALSTPQLDSDGDSQFTLTPCDAVKGQIPGSLKTSSLSSLKDGKEEDQGSLSSTGRKKGSVSSLLSSGETNCPSREGSHRKGSWTDIFRSRSRSRSRSPQGSPRRLRKGSDTSAKCRSDTESNERNGTVSKKEKSKFLSSLFKIGNKKSPKSKSPSPPNTLLESQDASIVEVKKNKSTVNKVHQQKNELPKASQAKGALTEQTATTADKVCATKSEATVVLKEEKRNRPTDINLESVHGLPTTHIRQNHEEVDIIPQKVSDAPLTEQSKSEKEISPPHISDVEGNHESSESELTFEVNGSSKPPLEKDSEEDCEAETLLNQDSTDAEEFSAAEFQLPPPPVDSSHTHIKTPTRKQRLEVTTIPIERPRSTTPINIAPLEAFIQSATPSPDPCVEKIRLSLPGDQFGSRPRSPKKSGIKSWQDFCEEGLHSPRLNKRPQNEDEFDLALKSPVFDADAANNEDQNKYKLTESSSPEEASWVTFENIHDDNIARKPNTLNVTIEKDQKWKEDDAFQSGDLEKNIFPDSSSLCHSCGCDRHFVDVANEKFSHNSNPIIGAKEFPSEESRSDSSAEFSTEKPKSSIICECDCHKQTTSTVMPQSKQSKVKCKDSASSLEEHFTLQEEQK